MPEIKPHNGRPAIFIDGKVYPPMMATIRTIDNDKMRIDKEYYRQLGKAGIKIYFLICDTEWLKPGAINLFREEAEALLEVVPDAYIVPRIGLHPTNEWIKAHPEECCKYSDGTQPGTRLFTESYVTDLPMQYSMCSEKWREDAGKALSDTWDVLMSLPYADRIIGCFFAAGGTSEWYYILQMFNDNGAVLDHGESFRRNFTKYLTRKYGSDTMLQKAWGREDVTLENPAIPEPEAHYYTREIDLDCAVRKNMLSNAPVPAMESMGSNIGTFVNIDKRQDVYDFYRAWHNGTAESVIYYGSIIKTKTPDKLTGAFYGSFGCTNYFKDGTGAAVLKVLDSNVIDFLAAPGVYENRAPGGFVGQRETFDSFALRNKIFIIEDDSRTHHENRYFGSQYGLFDLEDSINVLKREFGRTICEDVQGWWFDQLLGGKRYKDPEMYKLFTRQTEIAHEAYSLDRTASSEIAFIFDEESAHVTSFRTTKELVELMRNYEIARIGAPVDQYYHNDMANPNMPSYKMYVFFNVFTLTNEEREAIKAKLRMDNAVAVWMYASGIINPEAQPKFDVANIEQLTGIKVGMINDCYDANFRFGGTETPFTDNLDKRFVFGNPTEKRTMCVGYAEDLNWSSSLYPVFYTEDKDADVAASFMTSGKPAFTVKKCDGFTSIFYGAKHIAAETMRNIAKGAGCHIYSDSGDVLFANRNYITFHASTSGKKTIKLPENSSAFEVYEKKYYCENSNEIIFDTVVGETKMFRITKK
ncbi:MAG: hypothetical protein IKU43_10415 [Clostridia bacterium]|nr:hypothetical protein [Clostridia bacterium]